MKKIEVKASIPDGILLHKAKHFPFWSWYEVIFLHDVFLGIEIVLNMILFVSVGVLFRLIDSVRSLNIARSDKISVKRVRNERREDSSCGDCHIGRRSHLHFSPIWRCNIVLQKPSATFSKKHLQKTTEKNISGRIDL